MKNIYLLSNQAKTSVSRHLNSISNPSRLRVLPIILLCLAFSVSAWGAALTLPHSWNADDGSSAYTAALGCTKTSLGSDYSSAPKLKFNNTGSSLTIQVASASGTVTFNFKQNGTDPGTFVVQESSDNDTYTTVKTVTWPGNGKSTSVSATLSSSARYIKLLHQTKGTGTNAAVGGVSITAGSSCSNTPTMSFTDATVNKTTDDASYTQTVNISGKGPGQTVAYASSDETIGEVNASGVVTLKGKAGSTTITASVLADGDYCSASATYTINVTQAPIDVTLHYKGTTATLDDQPNPCTLPTTGEYVAKACDAWTFDGWYDNTYAKSTSKPTYITQLTSTGHAYAVYKHTETSGGGGSTPVTKSMSTFTSTSGNVETDANISYLAEQGSASTAPAVNGGEIRIYQNGGLLTITANNSKKISSITIGSSMVTSVDYSVDGGADVEDNDISAGGTLLVDGINATTVVFTCTGADKNHRLYLNYLSVTYSDGGGSSTTYYSTDAECAPTVQATSSPWVTSAQGATVKVEVPVTATNFDASCTLSASVSGSGFSIVGWGANGNSVTAGEDLTTSLILEYNPTVYSSDATITFNSTYGGSQTPVYTAGTVHGRSLSGLFVIAIKNGGTWYALPADMSGAGTYAGVAVDVDDIDNPTKVTAGPATALYRLMGVHPSRYGDYGTRVRFMSEYNSKCLWSNQANGGTGINNGAVASSANSDNYEWTLVTTDGVTYAINTNVAKKIEEGRELRYFAGESRFGMYTSGNSSFRLLPVDCWTRATVTNVSSTYNTVTLTWAGKSGTEYNVYIDEGGVTKQTENNVSSPVTISGLDSETNYTWIISPGAKDNGCALSGAFTTNVAPINVTLSCDGTEYALGAQDKPYTLPTTGAYVANACTEWEFAGWTDGTYSKSTSAPTFITEMNTSGTAYAVYRKTDGAGGSEKYVRVTETEQITDGQYLIMCNTWGDADDDPSDDYDYFTALKGSLDASFDAANTNYITNVKRNTVEDTIGVTSATTANEVTITAVSGGHTIKTKSNYYIGRTTSGNGINSSKSEAYVNTLSISSNNFICEGSGGSIYLEFNTSWTGFRYYASGQEDIQLYKRTSGNTYYYSTSSECCNEVAPPTVTVDAIDESATISWDDQVGADNGYSLIVKQGSTTKYENTGIAAGTTSIVVSGLNPTTTYNYTVTAKGATCNRDYDGSFTTANCAVLPTGVSVSPNTSSAIVRWTHTSPTATVTVYSDNAASIVVTSVDDLASGGKVTGLAEGTTYYLRVFAGADCGSAITEFTTLSSAVILAEWFPDSIRINLTADTATATVLIEDKQEKKTGTTLYADKLFFSKYFEGEGSMKLIAIYNGTDHDIDLSGYKINVVTRSKNKSTGIWNQSNSEYDISSLGSIAQGQEIIFFSRPLSSEPGVYGCADTWLTNQATKNHSTDNPRWIECESGGSYISKKFTFNGDDALQLIDGSTVIDCFGAASGPMPLTTHNCRSEESWTESKIRNMDYGKTASDFPGIDPGDLDSYGIDLIHDSIELFTARAILFRDLSVVSGVDAVAKNTTDFVTFSKEWNGRYICASGTTGNGTCNSFKDLSLFDYNEYYAKFDSITTIDELGGKQNDDGTYTIPIPQLDTLSCTMLRINVYEGSELKTSAEYKVPIMVEDNKTTKDTIFICDYPTQTRTAETCKECDVVILKGATLTKDEHTGNDVDFIRNLTIYPGGTMNIPTSRTFNVSSVQFRVEGENVPFIKLAGTLQTSDQQVLVSRRINNSEAYFFSLPYDCNLSDVRWSNGEPAVLDEGFRIKEYDSQARADQGSTKGAPGHWKPVTPGSTLEAGKGYQISVNSKYLKELIFPLEIHTTNVSAAENQKEPHGDNIVPIHQYLSTTGKTINNENWNFIAQPYLCAMSPMAGDDITYGYLEYEIEEVAGEQQVVWYRREATNQYLTIYNPSSKTYDQKFWSSVSQLDPFLAFFVQGKTEGSFTFTENKRKNAPARHLASQAEVDDDPSIFVGVTLSGNGLTDQANLRVRQDFTEEEYKLGYDLLKFTTYYKDRPQVYMKTPSYQLAFQAVSDSVAKNTFLPMGVYCYKPGTYTFGLSNDYPIDEVEAVYLYDKVAGVTTNLLYDTYTITTSSQLYTNTRFALNVIVNRRAPQVTTDIGIPEAPDNMARKILINGHVYIQRGAAIYDITGKQMLNF